MKKEQSKKELDRFLEAQDPQFEVALAEIKAGKKKSHWMWYIFPQYKGLGTSETSQYYAIQSVDEAKRYLIHPVLGDRLRESCKELLLLEENNPLKVLGSPDDMKLQSSMTLFAAFDSSKGQLFHKVLDKYYGGIQDQMTLKLIND